MALELDTQIILLTDTVRKADATNLDLKAKVLEWLRTHGGDVRPELLADAYDMVYKKYGISIASLASSSEPEVPISALFPQSGWIGEYLRYTSRHEAPELFHFWTGVSVVCGAARRNFYFEHGYYRIFPNFFVILVAPPGRCKKTTATNIGVNLLQQLPDINILRDKLTPEGLFANLLETGRMQSKTQALSFDLLSAVFLHAPELKVFLGRENYNEGTIATLTSLYDCPDKFGFTTRGHGKQTIHNVHINLLGATTPEDLSVIMPDAAMGGGFLSRVIFAVQNKTDRCEPFPIPPDPLMREKLVAKLVDIRGNNGQVVQNEAARQWCAKWYTEYYQKAQEDISLSGYYERKQGHLIKLSVVLLLSEGADLIITPEVYEKSLSLLNYTEQFMPEAFSRVQVTQVGRDHERILAHLEKAGGKMSHSALLKKNYGYLSADMFKKAVGTLREAGMVQETTGKEHAYVLLKRR